MSRERTDLIREGKFKSSGKMFILAYEGNISEPQYYEALKWSLKYKEYLLRVISLKRDPNDTNSAPNHVFNKLKAIKEEFNFKKTDEFWMIIDKDQWMIDKWVDQCNKEQNFNMALSNPCFEFWLLLHIADINDFSEGELRKLLTNEKISNKKNYIDKKLGELLEKGYDKTNIKPQRFLVFLKKAITQAEALDSKDIMSSLGSHNFKLIKRLIE